MKLLFYAPDFAIGGAWTYLRLLLRGLNDRGHTIILIAHKAPGIDDGLEQVRPFVGSIYRLEPLRSFRDIRTHIRLLRSCDVVHFNFIKPNICFFPVLLAILLSPGTIRVGYNHLPIPAPSHYPFVAWFRSRGVEIMFRGLHTVMIPTECNITEFRKFYNVPRKSFSVISQAIDLEKFKIDVDTRRVREELGIARDTVIISVVARLVQQKGHIHTIEAIEKLIQKTQDFVVLFIGDGNLEAALKAEVKKRGLQDYFKFLGYRKDIPELMHITDILLLTSLWESLGLVFVEANACGVPAIGPDIPGVRYAIDDGATGYLIDSRNPGQVAEKVYELINDPEKRRRMGKAGKERAQRLFALERLVTETEELYSSLLNKKKR